MNFLVHISYSKSTTAIVWHLPKGWNLDFLEPWATKDQKMSWFSYVFWKHFENSLWLICLPLCSSVFCRVFSAPILAWIFFLTWDPVQEEEPGVFVGGEVQFFLEFLGWKTRRLEDDPPVQLPVTTLPKFNIAPEKWWLEDYFPIGKVTFLGLC